MNSSEQLRKVLTVVILILVFFLVGYVSYYLYSVSVGQPADNGDDTPVAGACGDQPNVQFEQGDKTSWFSGTNLTSMNLKVPVSQLHINCFTNNGTSVVTGGTITLTGPSYSNTFNSPSVDNLTLNNAGTYTATCKAGGVTCDSDSFTLLAASPQPQNNCPEQSDILFRKGSQTAWVQGSVITNEGFKVPISDFGIRCVDGAENNTTSTATITLTGPNGFSTTFNAGSQTNITLPSNGSYTARCKVGTTTCASDSFSIGSTGTPTPQPDPDPDPTPDDLPATGITDEPWGIGVAIFLLIFGYYLYKKRQEAQLLS